MKVKSKKFATLLITNGVILHSLWFRDCLVMEKNDKMSPGTRVKLTQVVTISQTTTRLWFKPLCLPFTHSPFTPWCAACRHHTDSKMPRRYLRLSRVRRDLRPSCSPQRLNCYSTLVSDTQSDLCDQGQTLFTSCSTHDVCLTRRRCFGQTHKTEWMMSFHFSPVSWNQKQKMSLTALHVARI